MRILQAFRIQFNRSMNHEDLFALLANRYTKSKLKKVTGLLSLAILVNKAMQPWGMPESGADNW